MKGSSVAAVRRVTNDGNASSANFCSSLLLSKDPGCASCSVSTPGPSVSSKSLGNPTLAYHAPCHHDKRQEARCARNLTTSFSGPIHETPLGLHYMQNPWTNLIDVC